MEEEDVGPENKFALIGISPGNIFDCQVVHYKSFRYQNFAF